MSNSSEQDQISLLERVQAPTPKVFRIIRNAGVILAVISTSLLSIQAQGVNVPEIVLFMADKAYALAGAIAALVAQFTVDYKAKAEREIFNK
ncbi:hypothetical protein [Siphonobacter curvatus]|uniref:Uncharacterized protein n=1 Tax=Siphonobacter curvatus TaxID=2094562 RepID=A0A2S7IN58_9BACT|nr:hypothetical protein [Siphonobacter curvatus]PQA59157.1 hypothetical protein C5O19_05740 [Siphonobacter curvatus]